MTGISSLPKGGYCQSQSGSFNVLEISNVPEQHPYKVNFSPTPAIPCLAHTEMMGPQTENKNSRLPG